MKGIRKKMASLGVAVMMFVSMMSIESSADNFSLKKSIPSQTSYYSTTQAGKYTVSMTVASISSSSVTVKCSGYVYRNGTWNSIVVTSRTSTGTSTKTGSWYQINSGLDSKNVVSISPTSGTASGTTTGY